MLDWTRYAIFWGVFPLGFTGAEDVLDDVERDPAHRLPRLLGWLDHLVELGCNGLLLNPLFASMSHGYDTLDYFRVDPRIGDLDDFDALVAGCHERGIRVVLDGVFNHVGRDYPGSAELTNGEVFEGEQQLVVLNHDDDAVQQLVRDVMIFWLERGVDGWRLDAAYAVPPEFWSQVVPAVRERFGEAWFLGEMIHGDYAAYAETAGLDSITQYELWKAMWSSIENQNFFELDHTLGRHAELLERVWSRSRSWTTTTPPGWPVRSATTGTGDTPSRCCCSCLASPASTTATSWAWKGSRRSGWAATTRSGRSCPAHRLRSRT